jgi:hypothetical protein
LYVLVFPEAPEVLEPSGAFFLHADPGMKPQLKRLSDQVIVITGASSGIGLTTAEMAAERGAAVILAARSEAAHGGDSLYAPSGEDYGRRRSRATRRA